MFPGHLFWCLGRYGGGHICGGEKMGDRFSGTCEFCSGHPGIEQASNNWNEKLNAVGGWGGGEEGELGVAPWDRAWFGGDRARVRAVTPG